MMTQQARQPNPSRPKSSGSASNGNVRVFRRDTELSFFDEFYQEARLMLVKGKISTLRKGMVLLCDEEELSRKDDETMSTTTISTTKSSLSQALHEKGSGSKFGRQFMVKAVCRQSNVARAERNAAAILATMGDHECIAKMDAIWEEKQGSLDGIDDDEDDEDMIPRRRGMSSKDAKIAKMKAINPLQLPVGAQSVASSTGSAVELGTLFTATTFPARGDAFEVVEYKKGASPEALAAHIAKSLFSALAHAHHSGIIHMDVRPENVYLYADGSVRLGNFGRAIDSAKRFDMATKKTSSSSRGPLVYRAPEMLFSDANTTPAVDIWGAGLTVFTLVTGLDPWIRHSSERADDDLIFTRIASVDINTIPPHVSKAGRHFITRCLEHDPNTRMTAEEALSHPWLKISALVDEGDLPPSKMVIPQQQMRNDM